ncbi:MAG TPA: PilT/PilU family type 4a pilus ATPase, partial [Terriglobia bacterium]|nr:PilT/PilU family type 4a pilus ATPase [Terriglobia bacterium]
IDHSGSDLFLVTGLPPSIRVDGEVRPLDEEVLSGQDIVDALESSLQKRMMERYRSGESSIDTSFEFPLLGRFRVNLHRERGRPAAAIRTFANRPPQLGELGFTRSIDAITRLPYGLVLIGGPTGSGKTTTLAALINEINRREARHIITIEDPIEYEHPHGRSVIEQVEIGVDAPDFPTALRSALRQAPDVLVVGEMRDPETMRIALAAAETGHLVFSTLHTGDLASTISRISDSFSAERQPTIRQELAMALAAVMTQILLPKTGGGRVPAAELLMMGYGARQHVRKNALQHLHQELTITRADGSFSMEESLADLVRLGLIDQSEARDHTRHRDELEIHFRGPRTS